MGDVIDRVLLIVMIGGPLFGLGVSGLLWLAQHWPDLGNRVRRTRAALSSVSASEPSSSRVDPVRDPRTDGRTDGRTKPDPALDRHLELWRKFLLDRNRETLIALMVDGGLDKTAVRTLIKGGNAELGELVDAAQQYLDEARPLARTPIANRPVDARQFERPALVEGD